MRTRKWCAILGLGVAVLITLSLLSVAAPVLPCAFYGNVTIGGMPAPVGTEITAKIDNKPCGTITVTEAGRYGGPGGFDPKLVVNGSAEDENKLVSFYVDGAKAAETAIWNTGGVKYQDLTVEARWDVNEDCTVNFIDLTILSAHWLETPTAPLPRYDINEDGVINFIDLTILSAHWLETTC